VDDDGDDDDMMAKMMVMSMVDYGDDNKFDDDLCNFHEYRIIPFIYFVFIIIIYYHHR
jgi:hypothetical protein